MRYTAGMYLFIILLAGCTMKKEKMIEKAVRIQLSNFPESTLQDIYKNFFQDAYGPRHLLSDTVAALSYLKNELQQVHKQSQYTHENNHQRKTRFARHITWLRHVLDYWRFCLIPCPR